MKKPIKKWIGVDPDDESVVLLWSLADTRSECRQMLDAYCWGARRVYRVTLTLSHPKRGKK